MLKKIKFAIIRFLSLVPFYDKARISIRLGKDLRYYCNFTSRSQWFTQEEMDNYQNNHLQEIIGYAYAHVPFYRRLFDEHGTPANKIRSTQDLSQLPIVENETLRRNPQDFQSDELIRFQPVVNKTSGSTGKPLEVYIDKKTNALAQALIWRHFNWAHCYFHSKSVVIGPPFGFRSGHVDTQKLLRPTVSLDPQA
jgi:phenylacetate-coenzyme A ligase PaaK-like adenylate-forming protein